MEEQTNFSLEELESLLETFDNMNNQNIQGTTKVGFKKPYLQIDNLCLEEANIRTFYHIFRQKAINDQKSSFTIDDMIDKEYLECPECGRKMYYFSYYERFGCPKCLYATNKMTIDKDNSLTRTRKEEGK